MKIKFLLAVSLVVSGISSECRGGLILGDLALTGNHQANTVAASPNTGGGDAAILNLNLFPTSGNSIDLLGTMAQPKMRLGFSGLWDLIDNGTWNAPLTFNGINSEDILTVTPSVPVSGFLFIMNHVDLTVLANNYATLTAKGSGGNVLETHTFTLSLPGSLGSLNDVRNARGIERGANEIYSFELSGYYPVFNSLRVATQAANVVPEPSTFSMMAFCGLAMAGYSRLRRRRK